MIEQEFEWTVSYFDDLDARILYEILRLRQMVFVVEQHCPYSDIDNQDQNCLHICGWSGGTLVAYARVSPPESIYIEVSAGRIITHSDFRGQGLGRKLMDTTLEAIEAYFGEVPIRIHAQTYLIPFYKGFGFEEEGEVILDEGMPHIEMVRK